MDQLVVAVDGSQHSTKVVDYALQLAKSIQGSIVLVNVIPDPHVPSGYVEYTKVEGLDPGVYYEQVSQVILESMGTLIKKAGVKYEAIAGTGNPANFIIDIAKRKKACLIVVGVFGLHHLGRIRSLGSVSRRVVENSTVPVVLVP